MARGVGQALLVGVWMYKQKARSEAHYIVRAQKLTPVPSLCKGSRLDLPVLGKHCTCTLLVFIFIVGGESINSGLDAASFEKHVPSPAQGLDVDSSVD